MVSLAFLDSPVPMGHGPWPPAVETRIAQVVRLSNRGEYEDAAEGAEALLSERIGDPRVHGRYLFGVSLDRGFAILPGVLDALAAAMESPAAPPTDKARGDLEASLMWFGRTLRERIDFHHVQRDDAYRAWIATSEPSLPDAIRDAAARLAGAIERACPGSRSLEYVAGLGAFANATLRSLIPRPAPPPPPPRAAPPPPPEPARVEEIAEPVEEDDPPLPEDPAPPPRRRAEAAIAEGPAADDSPALALLKHKLAVFEALMERGDFARAAIVASDVDRIVESFDPRVYLPRLFRGYYRRLASGVGDLSPHMETAGSPGWRALEQLYQVDLDGFLDDG